MYTVWESNYLFDKCWTLGYLLLTQNKNKTENMLLKKENEINTLLNSTLYFSENK